MHRALVSVSFNFGGNLLHLREGELIDLAGLAPSEVDFLLAAWYVEKAAGEKAQAETPEGKRKRPERR
jgi:hypothetical protein